MVQHTIPLEEIAHATHAIGPDYYDGVIDIEMTDEDEERIKVGALNAAMHNLLSALNIYKRGAATLEVASWTREAGQVVGLVALQGAEAEEQGGSVGNGGGAERAPAAVGAAAVVASTPRSSSRRRRPRPLRPTPGSS